MDKKTELYDKLIAKCPGIEKKGKSVPHTSANGRMFSQLNRNGELGIRFSKEVQEKYMKELATGPFKSYGAVMKGYVLIPEKMWDNLNELAGYLNESHGYVKSLDQK
mgnify:FL=1